MPMNKAQNMVRRVKRCGEYKITREQLANMWARYQMEVWGYSTFVHSIWTTVAKTDMPLYDLASLPDTNINIIEDTESFRYSIPYASPEPVLLQSSGERPIDARITGGGNG